MIQQAYCVQKSRDPPPPPNDHDMATGKPQRRRRDTHRNSSPQIDVEHGNAIILDDETSNNRNSKFRSPTRLMFSLLRAVSSKRWIVGAILFSTLLFLWLIIHWLLFHRILVVFSVDLSLLLHPFANWLDLCGNNNSYLGQWKYMSHLDSRIQCTVDLCHVLHEGGEGVLFPATCHRRIININNETTTTFRALHKYVKLSSGRSAYHEVRATQRLAACSLFRGARNDISSGSPSMFFQVFDGGINYLTMTHLVDYGKLHVPPRRGGLDERWGSFLQDYLQVVGDQLECLHQGNYLHRDVYNPNILMLSSNNTTTKSGETTKNILVPRFQLIDASSSVPVDEWESTIASSLRGYTKQHLPIPPGLVCRLSWQTQEEKKYCADHHKEDIFGGEHEGGGPCLEWIDRYSLGVQALRLFHPINYTASPISTKGFSSVVQRHQIHIHALKAVKDRWNETQHAGGVLDRISQLILSDDRSNATCH